MSDPDVRLTAWVHGMVQGVGFRWWTRCRALELGLTGYAANQADGRVLVVAQGPREAGEKLLQLLQGGGTPGRVDKVVADGRSRASSSRFRRALRGPQCQTGHCCTVKLPMSNRERDSAGAITFQKATSILSQ